MHADGRRPRSVPEIHNWYRSNALVGVELINARNSWSETRVVTPAYGLVLFRSWRGRILTRGSRFNAAPGSAFCMMPEEPMAARPHGDVPGEFLAMEIAAETLTEWLSEQGHMGRPEWAAVVKPIDGEFSARFERLFQAVAQGASALEHQSRAAELSELILRELVLTRRAPFEQRTFARGAERMREYLHEYPDADLESLARAVGMNRFQALRAFKRRYGLPPHAYQLCRRVARARALLIEGLSGAETAAHCGFSDQSHLNRNFTRLCGITPQQYARFHGQPPRIGRDHDPARVAEAIVSSADRRAIRRRLAQGSLWRNSGSVQK